MEKKYYFRGLGLGIIVTAVIMGIALSGGGKKREMTDEEVIARAKELGMIEDSRLLEPSEEEKEEKKEEGKTAAGQEDGKGQVSVKTNAAVDRESAGEKQEVKQTDNQQAGSQKEKQEENRDENQEDKKSESEEAAPAAPENKSESAAKSVESDGTSAQAKKPAVSVEENRGTDTNEMTKQDEDVPISETDTEKSVTVAGGDGSYTVAKKLAEAGLVSSADSFDDFLCANGYDKKLRTGTFQIPSNADDRQIARILTGQE